MAQKILIVEDNSDLSQLLAFYLSDAGYETSQAGNLAQGISKALAERPDLIITDLYLPDMNAVDATVILKQDPATSGIPIVVLTGMTFGEWKTKALKAGVAKYLIKPVSPPELTEAVRTLIQQPSFLTEVSFSLTKKALTT
jgi:DNA-binding response OmpR family regulator